LKGAAGGFAALLEAAARPSFRTIPAPGVGARKFVKNQAFVLC